MSGTTTTGRSTWRNWAGNVTARPVREVSPASTEELADAVRKAAEDGLKVKAVGTGHSFTATAAATAPAAAGTTYPASAPAASTTQPAAEEPSATPTASPVLVQVMPSVRLERGTCASIRAMVVTIVGAMDRPATKSATARKGRFPASWRGIILTAIAHTPTSHLREAEPLRWSSPKTAPARQEPSAYTARTRLAAALCPCSSAKATVTTSTAPKIAPVATKVTTRTCSPGERSAEPPPWCSRGCGTGSVARCEVSQKTPITKNAAASSGPASGNQAVESPMETIGPTMKHTSSAIDSHEYAVCNSRGEPR